MFIYIMPLNKVNPEFEKFVKQLGYKGPLDWLFCPTCPEQRIHNSIEEIMKNCGGDKDCQKEKFFSLVKDLKEKLPYLNEKELKDMLKLILALWERLQLSLTEIQKELKELKTSIVGEDKQLSLSDENGEKLPEQGGNLRNPFLEGSVLEKLQKGEISPEEVVEYAVDLVLSSPKYQSYFVKMVRNPELIRACKGDNVCILENALLAGFAAPDGTPTDNYLALQQALSNLSSNEKEEVLESLYESATIAEALDDIIKAYIESIVKEGIVSKNDTKTREEVLNQEGVVGAVKKTYETMRSWIKEMLEMLNMKGKKAENWSNIITLGGVALGSWLAFKKAVLPIFQKGWKKFNNLPLRGKILTGVGLWFGKDVAEANGITLDWVKEFLFGKNVGEELEIQEDSPESRNFYLDSVLVAILPNNRSLEELIREGIIFYNQKAERYELNWEAMKDHPLVKVIIKNKYQGDDRHFREELNLTLNSVLNIVFQDRYVSSKAKLKDIVAKKWMLVGKLKMMVTPEKWEKLKEIGKNVDVMAIILKFEKGELSFEQAQSEIQRILDEISGGAKNNLGNSSPQLPGGTKGFIAGGSTAAGGSSSLTGSTDNSSHAPKTKEGSSESLIGITEESASNGKMERQESVDFLFNKLRQLIEEEVKSCSCPESQKEEVRVDAYALAYFIFMNNPSADLKYVEQQIKDYIRQQAIQETVDIFVGNPEPSLDIFEFIKTEIDKLDNEKAEKLAKKMVVLSGAQTLLNILLHYCGDDCQDAKSMVAEKLADTNLEVEKLLKSQLSNDSSVDTMLEKVLSVYEGIFNWAIGYLIQEPPIKNRLSGLLKERKTLSEIFKCEKTSSFKDCKKNVDRTIAKILVELGDSNLAADRLNQYFVPPENIDEKHLQNHTNNIKDLLVIWSYAISGSIEKKSSVFVKEGIVDEKSIYTNRKNKKYIDFSKLNFQVENALEKRLKEVSQFYGSFRFFDIKISNILNDVEQQNVLKNAYSRFVVVVRDKDILSAYGIDAKKLKWQPNSNLLDWVKIDDKTREKLINLFDAFLASELLMEAIRKVAESEKMLDAIDKQYSGAKELIKFVTKEIGKGGSALRKTILIGIGLTILAFSTGFIGLEAAGIAASVFRLGVWGGRIARLIGGAGGFSLGSWGGEGMMQRGEISLQAFVGGVNENANAKEFLLNTVFFGAPELFGIGKWGRFANKLLPQKVIVGVGTAVGYGTIETLFDKELTFSNLAEAISMGLLMAFLHGRPVKVERRGGKYALVGVENAIKDSKMEINISPRIRVKVSNGEIRVMPVGQSSSSQSISESGKIYQKTESGILIPPEEEIRIPRDEFLNISDFSTHFQKLGLREDEIKALEFIQQQLKVLEGYNLRLATGGITGGAKEMIGLEFNRGRQTIKNTFEYWLTIGRGRPLIVKNNAGEEVGKILKEGDEILVELPNKEKYSFDEILRLRAKGKGSKGINDFIEALEGRGWKVAVPANLVRIDRPLKDPKTWEKILGNQDLIEIKLNNNYNVQIFKDDKKIKVTVKQGNKVIVDSRPIDSNREEHLLNYDPELLRMLKTRLREEVFLRNPVGKELLHNKVLAFQVGDQQFARLRLIERGGNKKYKVEIKRDGKRVDSKEFNTLEEALEELGKSGILVPYTQALLKRAGLWGAIKDKWENSLASKAWRWALDISSVPMIALEVRNDFKDGVDTPDIIQIGLGGLGMGVLSKITPLNKLESFVISYYLAKLGLEWLGPAKEYPMEDNG